MAKPPRPQAPAHEALLQGGRAAWDRAEQRHLQGWPVNVGNQCSPPSLHLLAGLLRLPLPTLWGSLLVSCGLIHLIYHGKLQGARPRRFICLESSQRSPGTA